MILPSIAESHENMIFTSSVFTKMLFFMQCNRNYNPYRLLQICFYHPFVLSYKPKKRIWFAASWWSGNEKYFCFLFKRVALCFKAMPNLTYFYKGIFLCYSCSHYNSILYHDFIVLGSSFLINENMTSSKNLALFKVFK